MRLWRVAREGSEGSQGKYDMASVSFVVLGLRTVDLGRVREFR